MRWVSRLFTTTNPTGLHRLPPSVCNKTRHSFENGTSTCPMFTYLDFKNTKLVLFYSDPQMHLTDSSNTTGFHVSPRGTSPILSRAAPVSSSPVPLSVQSSERRDSAGQSGSLSSTSWSQFLNLPQPEAAHRRWAYRSRARWRVLRCSCRCRWGSDQCIWSRSQHVWASESSDPRQIRSCFLMTSPHHNGLGSSAWWRSSTRLQETHMCNLDGVYTVQQQVLWSDFVQFKTCF